METLKGSDEETMTTVYRDVIMSLHSKKSRLIRQFKNNVDPKATITGQKYQKQDALNQLNGAMTYFRRLSGCDLYKYKNFDEAKGDQAMEEYMKKFDEKNAEYFGWENLPRLALRLTVDYPYLHDLIK